MLNYTTSAINRNFIIKIYGNGENKAVGVSGLLNAVNDETLVNKMLAKAFATMKDKQVCKLRRGLKVSFYSK